MSNRLTEATPSTGPTPTVPQPIGARGFLLVWTDIPAEDEREFNEWYNRRHVPDRLPGVPGFRTASRYVALGEGRKFLAVYETDSPEVLVSDAYLDLVRNRDPQTDRILPRFTDTVRTIGTISGGVGVGHGAFLGLLPIVPAPGREETLREEIVTRILPAFGRAEGFVRGMLIEHATAHAGPAVSAHVRTADRKFDWALIIEATSPTSEALAGDGPFASVRELGVATEGPFLFGAMLFAARD